MSPARSTRRFVRRVSISMVAAVLVVGVAGLVSIRLSTLRAGAITDVVDPALAANASTWQLAADARMAALSAPPTTSPGGPSAPGTAAAMAAQLRAVTAAEPTDGAVRPLVAREVAAAEAWSAAYGDLLADPARPDTRRAEAEAFTGLRTSSAAVTAELGRVRAQLHSDADRLRDAARLAFGLLVLVGLVAMAVVGALASRFLVAPQRHLTDVVERLRAGERDARAPTDEGSAEVREVAVALNGLADEVEAWRSAQAEADRLRRFSLDVSRTVREELHIEAVLRAVPLVGQALDADRAWLRLADGRSFGPVVGEWARGGLDLVAGDVPLAGDDPYGLAERLWHRGEALIQPYLTPDIDLGQRGLQGFVTATGATSLLVVPVGAGERLLGLLGWAMTDGPRGWTTEEVSWAQRVAADLGRALEHAQLFETQRELVDKLRDLDRRKDDFLSTVSHELRTPLTSIMGYLEMVRDGDAGAVSPELTRMLDVVGRNATRLRDLIDDLLVLARIEDGSLTTRREPVAVAEIVAHAALTVRPHADEGGVDLSIDAGPGALTVPGDPRHLEMVALNLMSNAVKFTPPGGHVSVVVRYDEQTREVLLTCADSGIGIPESDQAGMFGKFFRASNATREAIPGTGLGLSVIKGIVDAHGGAIALTSREGMGTIVTVRLPEASLVAV